MTIASWLKSTAEDIFTVGVHTLGSREGILCPVLPLLKDEILLRELHRGKGAPWLRETLLERQVRVCVKRSDPYVSRKFPGMSYY